MASNYPTHEIDAAGGAKPARPRRIHWKTAVIIVQCGALVGLIWWNWFAADRTYKVMSLYYVVPGTALALVAWWVLFSGFARKTRAIGVGVLLAAAGLFVLLVRVEGFGGDFLPQLAWRFAATAEQRAQEFWRARRSSADLRSAPHGNGTNAEAAAKRVAEAADASEPSSELPIAADDWPRFRGPLGDGIVRGVTLEADWDARPPEEAWRIPIGPGWSSFAVVGDLAFTQEQRGPDECIVCYDLETGSELWVHADAGRFSSTVAGDGPRATPTIADSRLYALGALGRLNCLDPFTGRVLWTTNILEDAGVQNLIWGMAGSPLVLGDLVIVNPGGNAATGANAGVAAYDRKTGRRVWADGDRPASYCAPRLEVLGDLRQVLVLDGVGLHGYAPAEGRRLWSFPWTNDPQINAAQPVLLPDGNLFISSGYAAGCALVAVERGGETWTARPAGWEHSTRFKAKFNDYVLHEGHIYGLDEGVLCCFDPATATRRWRRGRYGYGQVLLIQDSDLLVVQSEAGDVYLVDASPDEFRERARLPALAAKTWNHPVVAQGRLLVRNGEEAACYELSSGK